MESKPIVLHVGLKSGRTIDLLVSDWKITTHRVSGDLQEFEWTAHDRAKSQPLYLNGEQIESIVKDL